MPLLKTIQGATRRIGKPANWDDDKQCSTLSVRDVTVDGIPFMISAWELTADDIRRVQAGDTVKLWISGSTHPVVMLSVGDVD